MRLEMYRELTEIYLLDRRKSLDVLYLLDRNTQHVMVSRRCGGGRSWPESVPNSSQSIEFAKHQQIAWLLADYAALNAAAYEIVPHS